MKNNNHLKDNPKLRKRLRVIGVLLTSLGGLFILIGVIDLFSADMFNEPNLFWMIFLGMIILFPGLVCLSMGFMGSVARYQAGEMAPIAKDTANYLLDGTRDEFVKTIKQIKEDYLICPNCGEKLDDDSTFCNHCGKVLQITCKDCNTTNDSDSKFCKKCGSKLG